MKFTTKKNLEKITKEFIRNFITENEPELKCTQSKLCIPIIERIYRKMSIGIRFSGIKVEKNLICDGHHRYLAAKMADYPIEMIPSVKSLSAIVTQWDSIIFMEEDWDTPAKIRMLNEQDAEFNGIPLDRLIELLK